MTSLFLDFEPSVQLPEGLTYREAFLTEEEAALLVAWIDQQPWEIDLARRRQFHGGGYEEGSPKSPMPSILAELAERLHREGLVSEIPDRCLINEYEPGQGIAAHVDHHPRFGGEVVMISLLDAYPMRFTLAAQGRALDHWLSPRSVCVITGPSRYEWTHEIAKRRSDVVPGGGKKVRGRRISVTFRKAKA